MRKATILAVERLEERCLLSGLSVPALSSRPDATLKMYIDFDGDISRRFGSWAGIGGTDTNGPIPAYDIDGDMTCFSPTELENIRQIFQIVAEKYSPFDIDITTVDPGSLDDNRAGKIVVGGNGSWYSGGGGVAQLGGFWGPSENVGYLWNSPANVRFVGEGVAHEAGHMLGLSHQSNVNAGIVTTEYRTGAIMGRGDLDTPGGRWIIGDSTGRDWFDDSLDRRGLQDDVPVMIGRGLPLRADDHGDVRTSATLMQTTSTGFTANGVIEQESDADFFQFGSILPGTPFTVRVDVDSLAPMLDPRIELYDATGALVAEAQTGEYGESIEVASAASSLYYVAIRAGGSAGVDYNIGSYGVVMERNEGDDNTAGTATRIIGVQGVSGGRYAYGQHVITDFVSDSDEFDWYSFVVPVVGLGGGSVFVGLGNLSSNVDLFVLREGDRISGIEIGTADVIGSSENGGTVNESILVDAFSNTTVYIAVRHMDGPGTGYTLTLNIDRSDPGAALGLSDEGWGFRREYDHIGFGDTDSYRGHPVWLTGSASSIVVVDFEFEPYDAAAELVIGADVDHDSILDPSEVSSSHVASAGEILRLNNVRGRDGDRNPLLVEVRQFGSGRTNYRLSNRVDRMLVLDPNLITAGAHLYDLEDSRHGGRIIDLLDEDDDTDVIRLGQPAPGMFDILVNQSPLGGAKFALIADYNQNGNVDDDELLGEGNKISVQVGDDDPTPYYLVASYDPGFVELAEYEVIYRDGLVTDPAGESIQNPRKLLAGEGSVPGYVALTQDVPLLDRPTVYYQLDVAQAGMLQAGLKLDNNGAGQGSLDAGLVVIRDFNQNGQIDPDERLAGFAAGGSPSLGVHVEPGSYYIGVLVRQVGGHTKADPTRYVDYRLNYIIAPVADTTPVEVQIAQFSREQGLAGVYVKFTEDVEMTLGAGDVSLQLLAGNTSTVVPLIGQNYDANLKTLFVAMDPDSPAGNYRLHVRADSVADPAGNRLAQDYSYDFVIDLPLDFGDAPTAAQSGFASDYPVTLSQDGARHSSGSLRLGVLIDVEADGQPDQAAGHDGSGGDDNIGDDDEDGVIVTASLVAASTSATKSSFSIDSSGKGKLDAWIDFNQDGDWNDADEQLFATSLDLVAGPNIVSYTLPAGASVGDTYARFRISSAGGLGPTGPADDGEVEDDRLTILDGDSAVPGIIDLVVGDVEVIADGNDVVVRHDGKELFRAPGSTLASGTFLGTDDDDEVRLGDLTSALVASIALIYEGGAGRDTLKLIGSGQSLDLTDRTENQLTNIEQIDIIGASPNALTVDGQSVIDVTGSANTLLVIHDDDDIVDYAGAGWQVDPPIFEDGQQHHVLTNADARVETINTLPFQNPFASTDVNYSGQSTALDALQIINFLGRSESTSVALPAPTSVEELPERYYDVNGSGTATALDALNVINFLGRQLLGEGEVQGLVVSLQGVPMQIAPAAIADILKTGHQTIERAELDNSHRDAAIKGFAWTQSRAANAVDRFESSRPSQNENPILSDDDFAAWHLALKELLIELHR